MGGHEVLAELKGDPDLRLVRLVEFLARQAAREFYEQKVKKQGSRGS